MPEKIVLKQVSSEEATPPTNFYITLDGEVVFYGKLGKNSVEPLKKYQNRVIEARVQIGSNSVMLCLGEKAPIVPDVGDQISMD